MSAEDMPVFTIKAKDVLAVSTIERYKDLCEELGLVAQAMEVEKAIREIQNWQHRNPEEVKAPTHKHVPVNQ